MNDVILKREDLSQSIIGHTGLSTDSLINNWNEEESVGVKLDEVVMESDILRTEESENLSNKSFSKTTHRQIVVLKYDLTS